MEREDVLTDVMASCTVDRDSAKELVLTGCFGGSRLGWAQRCHVDVELLPDYIEELELELQSGMRILLDRHPNVLVAVEQQIRRHPEKTGMAALRSRLARSHCAK